MVHDLSSFQEEGAEDLPVLTRPRPPPPVYRWPGLEWEVYEAVPSQPWGSLGETQYQRAAELKAKSKESLI